MTLLEFYKLLETTDWFYSFSDDHSYWQKGRAQHQRNIKIAETSPEHKKLYEDYSKHMFSGDPWKTEKQPKPERPLYGVEFENGQVIIGELGLE